MKRVLSGFAAFSFLLLLAAWAQPADPEIPADDSFVTQDRKISRSRHHHHQSNDRHAFGEDILISSNEVVGGLVLFGGTADIQGTVEGNLVLIGGSAKVSGEVTGGVVLIGGGLDLSGNVGRDTVVVLGGADIKKTANLEGSSVLIGGPFRVAPEAQILGEKFTFPLGNILPKVQWFKAWVVHGLLLGRLLPLGVTWVWIVAGFILLFYLLVLVLFPGSVKSSYLALEQQPIASLISGLLTMILIAPLTVVLVMTVVGIVAVPIVKIALLLALIVGKTALLCFLGRSLGRTIGGNFLQAPFPAFIIGAILLTLLYVVPVLGIITWALGTVFGLGAALVALGNSFSREEASVTPVAVPVATLRPEVATPTAASSGEGAPPSVALGFQATPAAKTLGPADTLLLARAGFWRRFLAALLDILLLIVGAFFLVHVIGPFYLLVPIAYFVGMWTWKGTTVGSIVLGLKIIRTDGRPVNFAVALVRSLSSFFSAIVLFLGFLWSAWDREKQTWHDKIAGTIVVRMPKDFALI